MITKKITPMTMPAISPDERPSISFSAKNSKMGVRIEF